MAELAWLIPVLPIASFLFISLAGKSVPGQGDRVGIAAVGVAFILSAAVFWEAVGGATAAGSVLWATIGEHALRMGFRVDALSASMLVVVTLISLLVHIYSLGYMHGDVRYKRYYALLSLFTGAMLGLVLADNLLLLFIFWELIGLCSFLLIGHWYEQRSVAFSAMKAYLTTTVGDIGLLIGLVLIWTHARTFEFAGIAEAIATGQLGGTLLTVIALLVFFGAVGKSAQFPLHVWLPDAMAGPTSVSALIHAATLVAAGVYLVARSFDIFVAAPDAMAVVAWIGAFTAIFAASIALVQDDIKRVLAFSTISQLGFMMLGLGVGAYTAAVFHLITHAFFKALLFLGSGSVIHGVDTQDMKEMGGLWRKMPVTFWTWLVGSAALAGIWPLSGFWSKDEILIEAFHASSPLFWIAVAAAAMTAFYITRATALTFFGSPRDREKFDRAHESPVSMTVPLLILGVLAAGAGYLNAGPTGYWLSGFVFFGQPHEALDAGIVPTVATVSWVLGVALAVVLYGFQWISRQSIVENLAPLHSLLKERYFIDEFYYLVFVKGAVLLSRLVAWFDRVVVDGVVNAVGVGTARAAVGAGRFDLRVVDGAVNGVAAAFRAGGAYLRRVQTGFVQSYALALFLTVVAGLLIFAIGGSQF